jgi:hypothetical protein
MKIILTPINLNSSLSLTSNSLKARDDYIYEKKYFDKSTDENPLWDDTKKNQSKAGYKFAFVNQKDDIMEIFNIIGILNSDVRREHWDINSHRDRRVLVLSKKIKEIKFSKYKEIVGYKEKYSIRGTCLSKWSDQLIK